MTDYHLYLEDRSHLNDEWANSLTHGIGLFASVIGLFVLIISALNEGNHWKLVNYIIYGSSLVALYAASTLYHALKDLRLRVLFRKVDHCAIYLLIAGSYTPITMMVLDEFWGWTLFTIIWSLALVGIIFKLFFVHRFKFLSTAIYLLMGWLVVIAIEPLMSRFPLEGLYWIGLGGLSYTLGVIFFLLDHKRFYHAIWHLFVVGGSGCHYFAILFYV